MDQSPFFADLADGPNGGFTKWVRADDGVRLRLGIWPEGQRGTVLLFPGRTEYVEKYGRTARDLRDHDFATATIDWRGQGLSDRFLDDRRIGHVLDFADYQNDAAILIRTVAELDLPKPYFLLAHSMGGCIGLRSAMEGYKVRAAAFSAPMWGILISPPLRPVAQVLSWAAVSFGQGHRPVPGTGGPGYVMEAAFEDNTLTRDAEMFDYMRRQLAAHPLLSLSGPSMHWLRQALAETAALAARPSPRLPAITLLGTRERVVDPDAVTTRMSRWPEGRLEMIEDAEHEVLMERPPIRKRAIDQIAALFAENL